ncbi:S8 family peptidase [Bacillus marasmi]|uniref:S8 family peptidase n=1 Tax=Bacillus marasmi TaxID=1926279 RepID=UPI00164E672A|nr:S8 family peptidase [Bacillus marasmi]
MTDKFRPILGRGENYIFPDQNRPGAPVTDRRPSYEDARGRLLSQIHTVKDQVKEIPAENRLDEVIFNMKMALGYTAKSYHPNNLIKQSGIKDVGSKKWQVKEVNNGKETIKQGKSIFLRMSEDELVYLERLLNQKSSDLPKGFIDDIRTVEEFYIGDNDYLLDIFNQDWNGGRVEFVLHPFGNLEDVAEERFMNLLNKYGGNPNKAKVRSYSPGPTFISAYVERETLEHLVNFNPIRTVHPMVFRGVPEIRGSLTNLALPKPPLENTKSSITVGVFDGGLKEDSPYFSDFSKENNPIETEEIPDFIQHGTGVVGTILYGDLKEYGKEDTLETPFVNVESFRVLPPSDPNDIDLYEVIDVIEDVVPKRTDIKIYNLSIGPYGPIEDDYISRFTYVIDSLSQNGERLFTVAVGNDGDMEDDDSRRIQSPSDTVNGLGIGAYTFDQEQKIIRAPYSCIGEGREGAKVKPDIVEFGGCERNPFHLVGLDGKSRFFASGTSFAAPLVARKAAEIMGRCNLVDPLVAKALIINSSMHPEMQFDRYLGYGATPAKVEEILGCDTNRVTVLYKQRILPKKYARLEIPVVKDLDYNGKVNIYWTIAIAAKPNPLNTEDYTTSGIEEYFYPNVNDYKFTSPDNKHNYKRNLLTQEDEVQELLNQNWKQSRFPVTKSGTMYLNEQERRAEFKWDTIVKKGVSVQYKNLDSPFLVLHAMDRNIEEHLSDFFNYAVVVTVEYEKYQGDAYQSTVSQFNKLEMAQVKNRNELFVK